MTPRFSVLTAVCDPPIAVLERCLASVREQDSDDWEHVVVDDASTDPAVRDALVDAADDSRVTVVFRPRRGGIVAASNDALAAASGALVALLDHDDELAPAALSTMAAAFGTDDDGSECDVAYSDHDLIRTDGRRGEPFYKPDFSPERLRHQNYITHLLTARRSLINEVGGFRAGFDGAQDHDLVLRLTEAARRVVHVPEVLYHWRQVAGSVALDPSAKQYAYENGRRAVEDHCLRCGIDADVDLGGDLGTFVVRRRATRPITLLVAAPLHTGIVWGRERHHLTRLATSIAALARRSVIDVIIAVPCGGEALARQLLADAACPAHVVGATAASALWPAALDALSTSTGIANSVVIPLVESMQLDEHRNDITGLAAHLASADVAIVGSTQLQSDRTIRHGGFITDHLGTHPILTGWAGSHPGPGRLMQVAREVGAVDIVGAAMRAADFRAICAGAANNAAAGTDVDIASIGPLFSVEQRTAGSRVVWTPQAVWYRFEPPPTGLASVSATDPYSNPNLAPGRGDWLELPGRGGATSYDLDESGQRIWS